MVRTHQGDSAGRCQILPPYPLPALGPSGVTAGGMEGRAAPSLVLHSAAS